MNTPNIRKMLVATDFSEGSDKALEVATELAKLVGASIELVHVSELATQDFPMGTSFYTVDRGGYLAYVGIELAKRSRGVQAAGVTCETKSLDGRPATEIVARAIEMNAGLIVLGTHGRRGIAHAILGSVAERVVQQARCPVLTVPQQRSA
jgi:nucleotide-binding universal stress UspA family protein